MPIAAEPSLRELIAARQPGFTLPAGLYTREDVFDRDVDVFFRQHWSCVAVEPELPRPGDVLAVALGPDSVLLVRGDDGKLRAFHNVCRHRGARLVDLGPANVGRIVCPYHQWTYGLDGALAYAVNMGRDFDRACHGLRPVHLRTIGGLVFVCLADAPPPDIDDMAAAMAPRLAPFALSEAKIAFEKDIVEEGNWKLTIENNRECYHCMGTHPELMQSYVASDLGFDPNDQTEEDAAALAEHEAATRELLARCAALNYPSATVDHMSGRRTIFRTQRLRIAGEGQSQTLDTKIASTRLMGAIAEPRLGDLHFWTCNSWHHFMSDHAVCITLHPLAAARTLVRTRWLVHRDAVEGRDYDLARLTQVWLATNRQDAELVGRAQLGVAGSGYRPGRYSPFAETYPEEFAGWYVEELARGLAP